MNDDEKIRELRRLYENRSNGVAKKILDSFASKTNWRSESLVHRIVLETQLSERDIRDFLKDKLQIALELGTYKKGAQGYKSRFEWKVEEPFGYSLVSVGLAAQGKSSTLKGAEDQELSEDEEAGELTEENVKVARDRFFKAEFPNDLTEKEFAHFVAHMNRVYFS
ncbi:hypothetical protein [uncultured Thiodictyon sp.]|jgi:hypothetical protein|uniref:hypothetical protein n=1 Tax=uncultured Thiodictyon sp. TaxID=1846217 RepID=UPI0025E7F9E8|nr:hypothetical protein [uncultured Thiodictyon sp.]